MSKLLPCLTAEHGSQLAAPKLELIAPWAMQAAASCLP